MEKQPDEPEDCTNEPLPSMSEPMEVQDAVASTSATPFAQPIITASKSKAQKQREYRQRIAASRTPAQAAAARKSKNERQRNNRLRQAANLAIASGSLEATTTSSSRSGEESNNVETRSQRQHAQQQSTTTADQPDERVNLTNKPLLSTIPAPKTRAQIQREYRQRIAASKTLAQAAAAREARNVRDRNNRLCQAANLGTPSGSLEATTTSSSSSGQRQSGVLNSAPANSPSPGAPEISAPGIPATMPQTQGTVPRTTATVHPYSVDARHMQVASRQPATYSQNIYNQYVQYSSKPQQSVIANNYPIHPDVKFRRLPFYDVLSDLLKPSSLVPQSNQRMQEGTFYFHLTPQQATDIASSRDTRPGVKFDYVKQVQMRFCLLETTCEQEDYFPPNVIVRVNNKPCNLPNPIPTNKPGVEPKRPPRPVNITPMVKLSPTVANTIAVQWAADYGRGYAITIALVHKLTSSDLLQRLKNKGAKHSDHTRGLIKEKLNEDADSEIATTSLRVSLMCPLGKMRMTTPSRAITCAHLQCFDASLFLQMNERKPTWSCPVCDKPALYDNLVIDGYFQEVLASTSLPSDANEIQLHKDGSWSTHIVEKKIPKAEKAAPVDDVEIICDDIEPIPEEVISTAAATSTSSKDEPKEDPKPKEKEVVDLTLSDSDEDEPLAKRRALNPKPDSTIKFSDTTSISSSSNQSRVTTTPGPSSVSSSGYPASPSVINLDSPSPPPQNKSPTQQTNNNNNTTNVNSVQSQPSSCMMTAQNAGTNGHQPTPTPPLFNSLGFVDFDTEDAGVVQNNYKTF